MTTPATLEHHNLTHFDHSDHCYAVTYMSAAQAVLRQRNGDRPIDLLTSAQCAYCFLEALVSVAAQMSGSPLNAATEAYRNLMVDIGGEPDIWTVWEEALQ